MRAVDLRLVRGALCVDPRRGPIGAVRGNRDTAARSGQACTMGCQGTRENPSNMEDPGTTAAPGTVQNLAPYVVRRDGDRWIISPSSLLAGIMVGAFSFGGAISVYLAGRFARPVGTGTTTHWIGRVFLVLAGFSAVLAVRARRIRRTPLIIAPGGRGRYGHRELCAAGMARTVRTSQSRMGDLGDVEIWLELSGGKIVSIPSQYFPGFRAPARARPFAALFGRTLGVSVIES